MNTLIRPARQYALALALGLAGLAAPLITHALGLKGTAYLPIFFGIAAGSAFLPAAPLLATGVIGIALNALFTGMPAGPMLWFLLCEAAVFALLVTRDMPLAFWQKTALSLAAARLSSVLLLPFFSLPASQWLALRWEGLPGMALCLLIALASHKISAKR